jgi:hypothetical protein
MAQMTYDEAPATFLFFSEHAGLSRERRIADQDGGLASGPGVVRDLDFRDNLASAPNVRIWQRGRTSVSSQLSDSPD